VKVSREHARDLRAGRARTLRVNALPALPPPAPAATYAAVTVDLARLRAAVAVQRRTSRSLAEMRRSHDDLDRTLAHAITQAFAADGHGAPTPEGVISWAAEGLARSYERELAIFAAMDACGPAQPQSGRGRR
jgi:hypothetical protein